MGIDANLQGAVLSAGNRVTNTGSRGSPVVALHCSGADRTEWRKLPDAIGAGYPVWAPNLIGHGSNGHWPGDHAFTLADEALPLVDLVDAVEGPVHLVGHSYGGAVALKIACARPGRIASLSLYEPSAFSLLRLTGAHNEMAEIEGLAAAVSRGVLTGAYTQAAQTFIDYWNGPGSWASLSPATCEAVLAWLPKGPLEFRALIEDDTPLAATRQLACPVLILCGEHAAATSRCVVEALAELLPHCCVKTVGGAARLG